ncbi:unnamed protein product [Colias eurytheme]|nr:unnamed protein product [Colias eurytheme]
MRSILVIISIATFTNNVYGARILGLFPHPGKSHHMVFDPLLKQLAQRGHQVTVASFFPLKEPIANYTDINFGDIIDTGTQELLDLSVIPEPNFITNSIVGKIIEITALFKMMETMACGVCEKAVGFPPLVAALQKDYDIVLVEAFISDCMLGLLHVHGIKVPIIGLSSSIILPWYYDRFGLFYNPAYLPVGFQPKQDRFTFMEKITNTVLLMMSNLWLYSFHGEEMKMIERQYGVEVPLHELSKNMSLMLVNTHFSFNGEKPSVPAIVEVGGMHLNHTRTALPTYIERFINESEHGVVLFSFGSLIKTSTIPKYKEEVIIKALSKLKQRVIWKYEESGEEGTLTGNILKVRWLPQFELLRHKKVVAFIAHGGLLGMTEAVSAGKPMLVVPFFGDQPSNAAAAESVGFAKVLRYSDLTEESLSAALESVLSAEMRLQARTVSKIWNDRQNPPLETAVYWVERVIRWGPVAKLHSPARDLAFYEYALLDVAAAYIAIILTTLALFWYSLSKLSRLFLKDSKQKLH